jgi:4-hydroxybenzoyl-CoA reductase subunit beta
MTLPRFDYARPATLEQALDVLHGADGQVKILAGGTDLVVSLQQKLFTPKVVLDIKGLRELRGISFDPAHGLHLGALTTIAQVAASSLIAQDFPVLAEAASLVAGPNQRSMATLGGNLCLDTRCYWYNQSYFWRKACQFCLKKDGEICHVAPGGKRCWAVYSGDLAPALLTLGASVRLVSRGGERVMPLQALYINEGRERFHLQSDELLTEVFVPSAMAGYRGSYQKFRVRGSVDYPLAGAAVAASLEDDGTIRDAQLAITAVNPAPQLIPGVAEVLRGQRPNEDLAGQVVERALRIARPLKTSASTPEYRRHMLGWLVKQGLQAVLGGDRHA